MRYWVYINDKVDGPYDETKLVTLNGFSQNTLICSEEVASNGGQEWVKASSIFEFDEVPVQEEIPAPTSTPSSTAANDVPAANAHVFDESALLAKLSLLSDELSYLHRKLDSMQTDLDKAAKQNEKLAQQLAAQSTLAKAAAPETQKIQSVSPAPVTVTPAPTPTDDKKQEEKEIVKEVSAEPESFPDQAAPKEEELIIRSALDSIYGEKPIAQPQVEETFQDLLPEKEKEKVEKIEEELTFTPVEEKPEESTVKEALITTPSAEEISRDELINELTASPKEDILDQIIQEHQAQEDSSTPVVEDEAKKSGSIATGAAIAGTAALAGLAGMAALTDKKEADVKEASVEPAPAENLSIATDKNNPEFLEEVLPPDRMPADVPAKQDEKPASHIDLETLPSVDNATENLPSPEVTQDSAAPLEDTVQELVPGAVLEKKKQSEQEGFYLKPEDEIQEQAQAEQQPAGVLTDKDLEDAFGSQEESLSPTIQEVPDNQSPNDLTEIELKEGSTYLISDFVPPAQVGDDAAALDALNATFNHNINKQQETIIQDMLAVSNKAEKTQLLPTDGLPEDITANKVSLENTIQAKRGASLDIKTAPMVPEPANTPRLDVSELDDVNAQHDMKTSKPKLGLTKIVIGMLISLLLLIVLYVALGLLNMLPKSVNLFSPKDTPVATSSTEEFFQESSSDSAFTEGTTDESDETEQVLNDVQNLSLSNGFTLKEFVEAKHAAIAKDLISWEVADSIEPENYSVTIKVPPENPQNFKTVYRFNYNMENGLLEPTISDAKNLLDQAEGQA